MKKNNFFSHKIFFASYYLNWQISLGLSLLYVYASLLAICLNIAKPYYIAPIMQYKVENSYVKSSLFGADIFTNSTLGFSVNCAIALLLIYVVFLKEFKSGKSSLWLMSPFSRQQILYSKILFIWSIIFIMFIPQFICQLVIASISNDSNKYIGLVIFKNINFLIFQLVLTSIMILISAIFYNNVKYALWINIAILSFIYFISIVEKSFEQKFCNSWVKYILPSYLSNTDILRFKNPIIPTKANPITTGQLIEVKMWLKYVFLTINGFLAIGLPITSVEIIKRKDSNYC